MTIWQPDLSSDTRPKYRALADRLASDIRTGRLAAGTRLPPQRDLAYRLGVTVGTVGRAYDIAARAGLVAGEIGRGTYVLGEAGSEKPAQTGMYGITEPYLVSPSSATVPMRENRPADVGQNDAIDEAARRVLDRGEYGRLHSYVGNGSSGSLTNRKAGAAWIARSGLQADPERVIMTPGAQTAIAIAIIAGSRPGDLILAGELTYPAVSDLARSLDRRIMGLPLDQDGLCPDAFAKVAHDHAPSLLFDVPTVHNPTSSMMPEDRRQEIVAIARSHGVRLIEDEIYAGVLEHDQRPPPLAALYPEGTFFIAGLSKAVAPGLRSGFLLPPAELVGRARAVNHNLTLGCPPLMADIASELVTSGMAATLAERQRAEIVRRKAIATEILSGAEFATSEGAPHLWMTVPDPWRAATLSQAAFNRGVTIGAADEFMVGQTASAIHKVRICLGTPPHVEDVRRGLETIEDLLRRGPSDVAGTV